MSEMAANDGKDQGFRVREIDWQRTSRRVLTSAWIDGIALSDRAGLIDQGIDLELLGNRLIEIFLRHALRDGFFHADMHPGNLFIDPEGNLVAVDFGIMGRLRMRSAVPGGDPVGLHHPRLCPHRGGAFRCRLCAAHPGPGSVRTSAAGDRRADPRPHREDISMARLLTQLFEVTAQFDMQTQPQLLLLQKTMVVVEGVARSFNPQAQHVAGGDPGGAGMDERCAGAGAAARRGGVGSGDDRPAGCRPAGGAGGCPPHARLLSEMAEGGGLRLDHATVEDLAKAQARHGAAGRIALWIRALALVVMALALLR